MSVCRPNLKLFSCTHYFGSDHLKEERAEMLRCKSRRLNVLARPKYLTRRVIMEPPRVRRVQVIREYELPTRIKMLAMPKVRKLVASLDEYKKIIETHRIKNYNQLIQESIMTMYSRLANVHVKKKRKPKKWTKEDWERNCKWMHQRANPKMYSEMLTAVTPRKVVPLKQLQYSIFSLSQPRHPRPKYRPSYGYKSVVNDSAKHFIPSERLLALAEARKRFIDENEGDPWQVNPNALIYTPTERIKELATPRSKPTPFDELDLTNCGVLKRALTAATTTRTVELAQPKASEEEEQKERPLVSKSALKAKPTPRIIELAIPRQYSQ